MAGAGAATLGGAADSGVTGEIDVLGVAIGGAAAAELVGVGVGTPESVLSWGACSVLPQAANTNDVAKIDTYSPRLAWTRVTRRPSSIAWTGRSR